MLSHLLILGILARQPAPEASPTASPIPATASPSPQASPAALIVAPSAVNLNPAQQRVVQVTGATPPLNATLDQKLVNVTVDSRGSSVTVTASQATGSDVLHLTDANGARPTSRFEWRSMPERSCRKQP